MDGKHHDAFPVDMIQGGAGTTTNMNANEVIANRALEIMGHQYGEYQYCSPNGGVNCAQSTNGAYPAAIHLGMYATLSGRSGTQTTDRILRKEGRFADVLKVGRAIRRRAIGPDFPRFRQLSCAVEIVHLKTKIAEDFLTINMERRSVTGICARPGYAILCTENIARITGWKIRLTGDLVGARPILRAWSVTLPP